MTALTGVARARAALQAARPATLDRTTDPRVVEATTAWASWDSWPTSTARLRRLDDALRAIAGDRVTELRSFVNDRHRDESQSRSDAIRDWMAQREEQAP